jgi:hypothetical protein
MDDQSVLNEIETWPIAELKDLRKTCATYDDEHVPESSVEILGHFKDVRVNRCRATVMVVQQHADFHGRRPTSQAIPGARRSDDTEAIGSGNRSRVDGDKHTDSH